MWVISLIVKARGDFNPEGELDGEDGYGDELLLASESSVKNGEEVWLWLAAESCNENGEEDMLVLANKFDGTGN